MRSPLDTFHTPIVQSFDPEAKYSPFGENTTLFIREKWISRTYEHIKIFSMSNIYIL